MASARVALLKKVLPASSDSDPAIAHALSTSSNPPAGVSATTIKSAVLANAVADISDDNETLIRHILQDPQVSTLRDVAFRYDQAKVASISASSAAGGNGGVNDIESNEHHLDPRLAYASDQATFQSRLFHAEPTAVLHRMVQRNQVSARWT